MTRPRMLMVAFYPLDRLDTAPKVRISRMRSALAERTDLTFVCGTRASRRGALLRLLSRLDSFDAVYVETATSTATEVDLAFLMACRAAGLPLGVFIRDVYQLYPQFYDTRPLKNRLLKWAWQISTEVYRQTADVLFFPTEGMATHFDHPRKRMLPPAGLLVAGVDRGNAEERVIYTGGVSQAYGVDLLLAAMDQVHHRRPGVKLTLVCADGPQPLLAPYADRAWLDLKHLQADALLPEMNRATVAVIPFRPIPYSTLNVKLFDYLSYGMPVVATPWMDVARFIHDHRCGRIVGATAEDLAQGIMAILDSPEEARGLSNQALATIRQGNTWADRAQSVVQELLPSQTEESASL